MRISVTDRCNLRCTYCMPPEGFQLLPHDDVLSYEEIIRIVRIANSLGVNKFRITGGEPLVRKGVIDFIKEINSLEGVETVFTTNGILLEKYASALKTAGVQRLNISVDTLKPERFKSITGYDRLPSVLKGIEAAHRAGFSPIKLNVVLMKGVNDDELADFIELARERPYQVRFIEFMPMKDNSWEREKFIPSKEIEERVAALRPLLDDPASEKSAPSRTYLLDGYAGKIGFISPVSRHFCDSCNRIRLTSDGRIRSCLLRKGEVDIRAAIRSGADDDRIKELVASAVLLKPSGHRLDDDEPEDLDAFPAMTRMGG